MFIAEVVELSYCCVTAEVAGEDGCCFGVGAGELGEGLFGGCDEGGEGGVEF